MDDIKWAIEMAKYHIDQKQGVLIRNGWGWLENQKDSVILSEEEAAIKSEKQFAILLIRDIVAAHLLYNGLPRVFRKPGNEYQESVECDERVHYWKGPVTCDFYLHNDSTPFLTGNAYPLR